MIAHIVVLSLANRPGAELADVMAGLAGLQNALPGLLDFKHGENLDFEAMSPEYDYGFIATFESAQALADYAENETHRALGARLVALCREGRAGLKVIDLSI